MSDYDIYEKRINRYGTNPQQRLENGRRANFERFLKQSPHYTTFEYNDNTIECVFEPHRQNETRTMMHVLARADQHFEIGDIVTIVGGRFMFWYWDERRDSGYNRYVMVKMSHMIRWIDPDGEKQSSEAYMYFQEDNMLKNELKSRSRSDTLYLENLKLNFLLMPTTNKLPVSSYTSITTTGITQHFRITGFDIVSTPGIMYVSMDPTYERDLTPMPEQGPDDPDSDFFWIRGKKGDA